MNYFLKLSYSCKKKKSLTWHVMQRWQKIIEKSMLLYTRYHKGNKRKIVPDQPSTAIKQRWWGIEHFLIDNNHKSKQENWQILLQGWARGDPGVTRKHAKAAKLVYIAEERRAWMALLHKIQKRTNLNQWVETKCKDKLSIWSYWSIQLPSPSSSVLQCPWPALFCLTEKWQQKPHQVWTC